MSGVHSLGDDVGIRHLHGVLYSICCGLHLAETSSQSRMCTCVKMHVGAAHVNVHKLQHTHDVQSGLVMDSVAISLQSMKNVREVLDDPCARDVLLSR